MNPLGIGTEIVECLRIAQMIERHGEVFLTRVFTAAEIEYCSSRKLVTQQYAAWWVAKEAVLKALGARWGKGIHWRDIEIRSKPDASPPSVALAGGARELLEKLEVREIMLSVSHCRTHATAVAICLGE